MIQPSARRVANAFMQAQDKTAIKLRQMEVLMGLGKTFGVISGYRQADPDDPNSHEPKHVNKQRHGDLLADLSRMGYRAVPMRSQWSNERSLFIRDIEPDILFDLGRVYLQDSVIYKSADGVLGLYDFKRHVVEVGVKLDGSIPWVQSIKKDLYSKDRGNSFSFDFAKGMVPWNGHAVLTPRDVLAAVRAGAITPVA